ncbi:hypothetical protein C2S51_028651 [Perilla frutescens var. frutescens]|nr:hypothetical protein C2S51_028651 [Perilla frutescens var. frutescens]
MYVGMSENASVPDSAHFSHPKSAIFKPSLPMRMFRASMDPKLNYGKKQKNLDQEVREMISALTTYLDSIQRSNKTGSSSSQNQDEEEQGVMIINFFRINLDITMRSDGQQSCRRSSGAVSART